MTQKMFISGLTGNVGTACRMQCVRKLWEASGVSRKTNLNLVDWESTSEWIRQQQPFDIVVMAHGVQKPALLREITQKDWRDVIMNNLDASASLTTALMRHNKINPNGLVVYFSSIQATQPREGRSAYATAKAGIEGLCRAASVEWEESKVRTVCLRIGQMAQPMQGISFSSDYIKKLNHAIPGPWVHANDIAKLIFALYDQPSISGETIEISSGHRFNIWPK